MFILDLFLVRKNNTANLAKERLKIILTKNNRHLNEPDYFIALKKDVLTVIRKYVQINPDMVKIKFDKIEKNLSRLKLNITLLK
ncbi:cell division topological specificity factor MinE [Buchnera aphidicola (Formosaphis micheliae)]|uniref:cell division topological specificity factor MinE n=1 Tax=Buchnera aphidicola TaxID=9 RepID=UPI0031B88D93